MEDINAKFRTASWSQILLSPKWNWDFLALIFATAWHRFQRLSARSKTILCSVALLNIAIIIAIIIITPHRIAIFFNDLSTKLRGMGVGGMFIMGGLVVLTSHPPLFGSATTLTLIGYTWGIWPGFLIAGIAILTGSIITFLSVRTFFLQWMRSFGSGKNEKWNAFGKVMKAKGLPLIIMIRWCPLPFAINNGLFASIDSVSLPQFIIATLLYMPKLLVVVFVGSRLVSFTSPEPRDPLITYLNIATIVLSLSVSTAAGIWIYKLTLAQMRKVQGGGEAADILEHEQDLLGDYSDEDEPGGLRLDVERGRPGVKRRSSSGLGSDED